MKCVCEGSLVVSVCSLTNIYYTAYRIFGVIFLWVSLELRREKQRQQQPLYIGIGIPFTWWFDWIQCIRYSCIKYNTGEPCCLSYKNIQFECSIPLLLCSMFVHFTFDSSSGCAPFFLSLFRKIRKCCALLDVYECVCVCPCVCLCALYTLVCSYSYHTFHSWLLYFRFFPYHFVLFDFASLSLISSSYSPVAF